MTGRGQEVRASAVLGGLLLLVAWLGAGCSREPAPSPLASMGLPSAASSRSPSPTPAATPWVFATTGHPRTDVVARLQRWSTREEVAYFMESARLAGVTTVHLVVKQDEDDVIASGTVFYRSAVAPVWKDMRSLDLLAVAVDEAHARGLRLYAWIPQFHDAAAAAAHPDWEMQVAVDGVAVPYGDRSRQVFVNPVDPAVRAYEQAIVEEVVGGYGVDGVDLDWVRYDDVTMDVGPLTRRLATADLGVDPLTLPFADGLSDPRVVRWQVWRTQFVADHVTAVAAAVRAIRPDVHVAAFVLPQSFWEVGQDLSLFAGALDEVEPMCYWSDWGFDPAWVRSDCLATVDARIQHAGAATSVVPALGINESDAETRSVIADLAAHRPDLPGIAWFSFTPWPRERMAAAAAWTAGWPAVSP